MKTRPDFDAVLTQLGLAETKPKTAAPEKPESDVPLMDKVQALTFKEDFYSARRKRKSGYSQKVRNVLTSYRMKLRQAERFVLDENAVRLICHLSHEQEKLAGWSFLARLPYSVFWVEFSGRARVDEFRKMRAAAHPNSDMSEVAKTIGFLFYKDSGSDTRWIAHEFIEGDDGEAFIGMVSYIFDPSGDPKWPMRGSSTWNMPTLSLRPDFPKQALRITTGSDEAPVAVTYVDPEFGLCGLWDLPSDGKIVVPAIRADDGTIEIPDASDMLKAPVWFTSRAAVIVDPFWHFHFEENPDRLNELVMFQLPEEAGLMRWLVTFLASINALPQAVKPINVRQGRQRVGLVHSVPFMPHRNLTIELPRDNRVVWAKKNLDRERSSLGRRLAWHSVRGHWRIIEYGKAQGRVCRHMPAIVDESDPDLAICENCEMLIRWIEIPDGRGDIKLGVVDKTYQVKSKKRRLLSSEK